jgi:uncharacterized protein (UPF0335 family)
MMKVKRVEKDWVELAETKEIFLSIRGYGFETKEEAEIDSKICMIIVVFHMADHHFNEDDSLMGLELSYLNVKSMIESGIVAADYVLQEKYAKATRSNIERVEQILSEV